MQNITTFQFESHSIRVVMDESGETWFSANEVCSVLGFANPHDAVARHVDADDLGKREAIDSMGRKQMANHVNESGLYALIFGSSKAESKRFKRWVTSEVLPSIRKAGSYTAPAARQQGMSRNRLAASVILLRAAAEDLKLPPSAVLGGYKKLEAELGVSGLLPDYAVDAPSSAVAGSSEVTKAAGELLEDFGVGISTIAFNRLLVAKGFLVEHERPSSKGGTKKFKSVINLEFGKNVTSPSNPRETQPHWYVSKFAELLDLVMPAKPKAA